MVRGMKMAQRVMLSAAVLGVVATIGCDSEAGKADKVVYESIDTSVGKRNFLDDDSVKRAIDDLTKAVGTAAASSATKAQAYAGLAAAEADAAQLSMVQLRSIENEILRLVVQMHHLGQQVINSNRAIAGLKSRDIAESVKLLEGQIKAVQGDGGATEWVNTDGVIVKTISATKADITRLEGEITKLEGEIKDFTDQKAKASEEAATADAASQQAKGEEATTLYKKGADLRKTAADLQTKIDVNSQALVPLKADLDTAKGQLALLDVAAAAFKSQLTEIQKGWDAAQTGITEQQKVTQALVSGEKDSIAALAAQVVKLNGEAETLRGTIETKLNDSISHYESAVKAADDLRSTLQKLEADTQQKDPESPSLATWKSLREVLDPGSYRIPQGNVERLKGDLYAGKVATGRARVVLYGVVKPVIEKAGLETPKDLESGTIEAEIEKAKELALKNYGESATHLSNVVSGASATPERRQSATMGQMLTAYSWSKLNLVLDDKAGASEQLKLAEDFRKALPDTLTQQMILPADIAPVATVPTAPTAPTPTPGASPNAPTETPAPTPGTGTPPTGPGDGSELLR